MPRLDRLLSLYCFSPLRNLSSVKRPAIPILMYHSISDNAEDGVHPYFRLATTPEVFAQHMALLADQGYQVIGFDAALKFLCGDNSDNQNIPAKVIITFDDGFLDFYINAFPILARYGFTATVFLPTSFINDANTSINDKTFLSWSQVRELIKAGFTFGSHTVTHKHLNRLPRAQGEHELKKSKETIEDRTGSRVQTFSFPYAFPENDKDFVSFMRSKLQIYGYSCAVATRIGTAAIGDDLFSLRRIPVNNDDDSSLFKSKLAGGYNWLYSAQYMIKFMRGMLGMNRRNLEKWTSL